MAYSFEYGGSSGMERPGASRRSRVNEIHSRGFSNNAHKTSSLEPHRNSAYGNYQNDSNRFNRSTSGSRQYSYKLDNISNKLAERNNPLLSFYKDKSESRIKTAQRNYDSSHLKKNIENYGIAQNKTEKPKIAYHNEYANKPPKVETKAPISKRSSRRGHTTYSRSLLNSGENLMQTSAHKRFTTRQKQLDVIYEDPDVQDDLDPKQKEILEKYYLASRRNLRPSQRKMKTPLMTPDNDIKFVDNGSMIVNPKPTKTPPPPMWGEESEIDETEGEPFYDPNIDQARNSKALQHLDSSKSQRRQFLKKNLQDNGMEDEETETVIVQNKRPKGSKLKKKIVYVYDSDSDEEGEPNQQYLGSKRSNVLPYR